MDNCQVGLREANQQVGDQLSGGAERGTALPEGLLRKPLGHGLRDCAQKTADPFLNHGFNSLRPSKTDGRVLSVAMDVNIQASIETGFKRGDFFKVRHNADPLPKRAHQEPPAVFETATLVLSRQQQQAPHQAQQHVSTASIYRASSHL